MKRQWARNSPDGGGGGGRRRTGRWYSSRCICPADRAVHGQPARTSAAKPVAEMPDAEVAAADAVAAAAEVGAEGDC